MFRGSKETQQAAAQRVVEMMAYLSRAIECSRTIYPLLESEVDKNLIDVSRRRIAAELDSMETFYNSAAKVFNG